MVYILDPGQFLDAIVYDDLVAAKARKEVEGRARCQLYRVRGTQVERWIPDLGEWSPDPEAPIKVHEAARRSMR